MKSSSGLKRFAYVAHYGATLVLMAIIFISASMTVIIPHHDAPRALLVLGPIVALGSVWLLNRMHIWVYGDRDSPSSPPPQEESVTALDTKIRTVIAELAEVSHEDQDQRMPLIVRLEDLKRRRHAAVRTKAYDRMLTSLR